MPAVPRDRAPVEVAREPIERVPRLETSHRDAVASDDGFQRQLRELRYRSCGLIPLAAVAVVGVVAALALALVP
jgi:hypothetical protein